MIPDDGSGISQIEWIAASRTAESLILKYHGSARSEALKAHHKIVLELTRRYDWGLAYYYDRRTRALMAKDPRHDPTIVNQYLVIEATTKRGMAETNAMLATLRSPLPQQPTFSCPPSTSASPTPSPSSTKRFAPYDSSGRQSRHTRSPPKCFRCGVIGHFPATCNSEWTSAGLPCASWANGPGPRTGSLIDSATGQAFCHNWARGAYCRFADCCRNIHRCSICRNTQHGAIACPK